MKGNIERYQEQISSYKKRIEKLPEQRVGFLLRDYYYLRGSKFCTDRDTIENEVFKLVIHSHDTGVNVSSSIKTPSGELYEFARRTYWYNESQYGFNKWYYESGKWDDSYNKFLKELEDEFKEYYNNQINKAEKLIEEEKQLLQDKKSSVESMF